MYFFKRASTHSCTAAIAVLATMVLSTLLRAAETLRVEGGQIADVAPDASGVRAFRGIPYAAPPVGELRWKAPHPIQAWDGIRTAAAWGPRCVQSNRLGDIDPPEQADGRRLPISKRMDPNKIAERSTAGDGLDTRRQQPQRRWLAARI